MRIPVTKALFAWDCLEDGPSLTTVREFLEIVPDAKLLHALHQWRGRGRNDYSVGVLWRVLLLTILLRHVSIAACLDELRRNAGLRRAIGIRSEEEVPKKWNMSRFGELLGQEPHLGLLRGVFDTLARRLGLVVSDLGADTAGDATGLSARRDRKKDTRPNGVANALGLETEGDRSRRLDRSKPKPAGDSRQALPQPTGGRKEYTDAEGNATRVIEWFGYKLHLLVDVRHEVALAYRCTSANVGDNEVLPALVGQAKDNLPEGRMHTLAYDKAADSNEVHQKLDEEDISALIENRRLWKDQQERMLPGHDGNSNVVYDEAGTVYCYDKSSDPPVRHRMAYIGHEPSRGTLKYRCPAMHGRWRCPCHDHCNAGKKYGKTVRVKREIDPRRFPAIPRATKQFERRYRGRTAVERVNSRIKVYWGADDGNIVGARRFHAQVGTVMVVHLALATLLARCPRRDGTLGKMRLSPIAQALRQRAGLK